MVTGYRNSDNLVGKPRLLQVPESIHAAWKKGGESRASLLKMLQEANFDKDSLGDGIIPCTFFLLPFPLFISK